MALVDKRPPGAYCQAMDGTRERSQEKPKAVVMLSGGLDSATVAAIALQEGFAVTALSFDYGQRHVEELKAAKRVCEQLNIHDHRCLKVDLRTIGGSALTDSDIEVPKAGIEPGIPVTYVPARNTIFLSLALGLAEAIGAKVIYFGANALDYSGYPDCRPEFVQAFTQLANIATRSVDEPDGAYEIRAPLMTLSKADIVERGVALGVDFARTHSCYDPKPQGACGACDSCRLRRKGFLEAGVPDPTRYH